MLDIQFIRDNANLVKEKSKQKNIKVDVDALLKLDIERRDLLAKIEQLRAERNELADKLKAGNPSDKDIEKGKSIKTKLSELENIANPVSDSFEELLKQVPNIHFDDVPLGGEEDSVEVKSYGGKSKGGADHLDLAIKRDWVDFERGAKVSGAKFYFLKGDLAMLENALFQYVLDVVLKKGFTYMTVPHMVNSRIAEGTGFAPRGSEQEDEYFVQGEDLVLIGTAEIPLTGYHADEIIDEAKLPLLYAGYSPSYRKEAGTYGKHARGLFRVHHFNKLEMYAFTLPEDSSVMHENLLSIEEEIWQSLKIPYRVINIAAGDLGAPAAKKYDIEYWSPVDVKYRELTSCSNCTDFQARNLNIRVRRADGKVELLHTLNGTAVSLSRSLIAIIENYQDKDGNVEVPEVLKTYMQNRSIL